MVLYIALSTGCYPIMGQNMGQTVLREIAGFYLELFDPQNTRKSPDILRLQDFLWLRRQDLNLRPVAVPYIFYGGRCRLENIDRCHSLPSLLPPQAAVGSLPSGNPEVV